ncbi:MAG: NmrA/HSCARG family protein [Pseudomonadota bacterium]
MKPRTTVLVTGATGNQGGAVARTLVKQGMKVRALTRKPDSPAATKLEKLGVEVAAGSFDEEDALKTAMREVDAVFLMGTPYEAGTEAEIRHGKKAVEVARALHLRHVVYSSVANADLRTGIPHFDSKFEIEKYLQASDVPYTVLAPVFFMENALSPLMLPALKETRYALPLPAPRQLQQVALSDLAEVAAVVIQERHPFLGLRVDVASDELTGDEAARVLSRVTGRTIRYEAVSLDQARASSEDLAKMFEWFDRTGYSVDIAALRRRFPNVRWHTFETWAREQDWHAVNRRHPEGPDPSGAYVRTPRRVRGLPHFL